MAPLESEWMLWAKRLRYEHNFLLNRLDAAEKAISKTGTLSDTVKDLTTEHHDMKEKFRGLEEHMAQKENDAGRDVARLQGITAGLEEEIARIAGNLNDWKKDWAQCPEQEKLKENRRQKQPPAAFSSISASVASRKAKRGPSKLLAQNPSREPSLSALPALPALPDGSVETRGLSQDCIGLRTQGDSTLEEYLAYGESAVRRAVEMYETRAVKAFVSGIREKRQQEMLWETLDEDGWSWQNARKVLRKVHLNHRRKWNKKKLGRHEPAMPETLGEC